jgi:hypothetical protein
MTDWRISAPGKWARLTRISIVLAGIVFGQAVLYWPSLLGRRVLLPLDILAKPLVYLPQTPESATLETKNRFLSDMIFVDEPARRFAVSEFHAGRLPMWAPYLFAGAPFVWPKFSPFYAIRCGTESPVILAWAQLLVALVAGMGAYLFFRRVPAVGFWPATICAWCYPLTGFFILWQGYAVTAAVCWLPWVLLAVATTVRRASRWGPLGVSVVPALF